MAEKQNCCIEATGVAFRENRSLLTRSEKIIWLFLAATSCQLTFLFPYVILAPGQRVNLFSGLLCFLTLAAALVFGRRGVIKFKSPEFLVSAGLLVLGAVSSLSSLTPWSSSLRVFVLLASGLGGFWGARLLLATPENQRRFQALCLVLLGGLVLLSLGKFLFDPLFHGYPHPLINVIFLLSFAPLTLLGQKSRPLVLLGIILLVLSYAVLCLSQRLSVVFMPIGLGLLGGLFGAWRWKHLAAALVVMGIIVGFSYHNILWFKLNKEYPSYRIENLFFSWSIAKQHPLLGIGVRTPREQFLKDYQTKYPYDNKERFAKDLADIVTADNQILTFLVGLGFPFTIIYCLAVLTLMAKLIRLAWRPPPPGLAIPPLALLFPLALALVHWQLYDGLFFPQNSWFFHLLLGLIPVGAASPAVREAGTRGDLSFSPFKPNPQTETGGE